MIDKRLIKLLPESKIYTMIILIMKTAILLINSGLIYSLLGFLWGEERILVPIILVVFKKIVIYLNNYVMARYSRFTKQVLRARFIEQVLLVENHYTEQLDTATLIQLSTDGINQLDAYYNLYIPQFFYSLLAPLILFIILSFFHIKTALILLIAVPIIPISIVIIQKFAKKLLHKYWGKYTELGNIFLDRLQGLLPLKIFQAEARTLAEIDAEAESFRKVTMRVLMMQLNSISVMDLVAYGGSALAMMTALIALQRGMINLKSMLFITLLSADYFIPMRQLGSYFHLSMNGVAASDKITAFLDLQIDDSMSLNNFEPQCLKIDNVSIDYGRMKSVVKGVSFTVEKGNYHVIVGESGSGKSSIAKAILNQIDYQGNIYLDDIDIKDKCINEHILGHLGSQDVFNMTVYENMKMGMSHSKKDCQHVLERLGLGALKLDQVLQEGGTNLSGGERQRLVMSRSLLNYRDFYIFDEVTSNVDVESEAILLNEINNLRNKGSGIVFITHRLENAKEADVIHVFSNGELVEQGNHQDLMNLKGVYAQLYKKQKEVESIGT